MTHQEILGHIQVIIKEIADSRGLKVPNIDASTLLLGGALPFDSLDLATLVVELERLTGHDPFKAGFIDFRTAGELAQLYQR